MSDTAPIEHPSWLTGGDFTAADEPLRLFAAWLEGGHAHREPRDPNAMALATVDADGLPERADGAAEGRRRARLRLLHQHGQPKGAGVGRQPEGRAAVPLEVARTGRCRCAGRSSTVTDAEADAYFATRPKQAQIGAWASKQSSPLESRLAFEKAVALYAAKYAIGSGAAAAALVRLSHRADADRVLAGPAVPPARPRRVPPRASSARRGARRGFIRELVLDHADRRNQPAAPHAAADRSEPRHRPRDGEALLRRRLARDHLLAPSVPGKLPVGDGPGGSHPGRPRRSRPTRQQAIDEIKRRLDRRRTARAGQQRRDLAQGRGRQAARLDRHHASTSGGTCSR